NVKGSQDPQNRWEKSAGRAIGSTTLANVLSMTRYGGEVRPVDWRAAWVCRLRSRRLSCVVLRFSTSAPSCVRWPIGEWGDNGWAAASIRGSLRPLRARTGVARWSRGAAASSRAAFAVASWLTSGNRVEDLLTKIRQSRA